MIPSLVAAEVKGALKDFLSSQFRPSNAHLASIVDNFLEDEASLLRGPYVSLSLPYERVRDGDEPFPEIPLGFTPYLHQRDAFIRLMHGRSTIIATGTGSGKTEAFLYPILDWCREHSGQPGIKAILIYPMNALANDQAGRIARIVHSTKSLRNKIVAGLFVGQRTKSPDKRMTAKRVISSRETLLERPPDVLLTNYKMLDYLLSRPRDQRLWRCNAPDTLRWLVVDELHTFDGAQGTDLACLLRRLKSRLRVNVDNLVCVGTSATLGSGAGSDSEPAADNPGGMLFPLPLFEQPVEPLGDRRNGELLKYAEQIFGTSFNPGSIVREKRLSVTRFLGDMLLTHHLLPRGDLSTFLDRRRFGSSEEYLRSQYELFFGEDPGDDFFRDDWRVTLARRLRGHSAFVNLLHILGGRPKLQSSVVSRFRKSVPWCRSEDLESILNGLFALISAARSREAGGPNSALRPFLQVSFQLWVRELRRMVCSVSERPHLERESSSALVSRLRHSDDLGEDQAAIHLPLVQCQQCRVTGWVTVLNSASDRVRDDLGIIYNEFFARDISLRFLFPEVIPDSRKAFRASVCGACGNFRVGSSKGQCDRCGEYRDVEVSVPESTTQRTVGQGKDRQTRTVLSTDCPYCGASASLFILGARSATLLGVALGQTFASRHNDDQKVIAFSDNVQDAAHRAGFLSHRTWQNSKRAAIAQAVPGQEAISLSDLPSEVVARCSGVLQSTDAMSPMRLVEEFIAPDREWLRDFKAFRDTGKLPADSNLPQLVKQRLQWEAVSEFGFGASTVRSLERTMAATAGPDVSRLKEACRHALTRIREEFEQLEDITEQPVRWIAIGLLRRMKDRGAIWSDSVDGVKRFLESGCNRWSLSYNLALPEFGPQVPMPRFPLDSVGGGERESVEPLATSGGGTWYQRWVGKVLQSRLSILESYHLTVILRIVLDCLQSQNLVRLRLAKDKRIWAINPSRFAVTRELVAMHGDTPTRLLVVPRREASIWLGAPNIDDGVTETYKYCKTAAPTWAGQMYLNAGIHRVVAVDHTGLLDRQKRESIERRFASDESLPFDPNVLSATPTLELGIDIGNLSIVALCSVPPGQANYIQRIGRAGRRDGNAFALTLAAAAPHDLYFYSEPLEMLDGAIDPPGVFLDASAVLERQLTSFCLDNWAETCDGPDAVPRKLGTVLDHVESSTAGVFPNTFFEYIERRVDFLFERFLEVFRSSLSDDSKDYLRVFLAGELGGLPELRARITVRLEQVVNERASIRKELVRLAAKQRKLRKGPLDQATTEDIRVIQRERKGLQRLRASINGRDTFGFLTDEGLIPNYAFPEAGVKLRSVILRRPPRSEVRQAAARESNEDTDLEVYEYVRPSVAALSELAPGNRFYAEGYKVEIDRVDLDVTSVEDWRLCPSCTHCRRIDVRDDFAACPRCGDPMWSDVGQVRKMLPLRLVHATTPIRRAQIMDDRDDRESYFFTRHLVADFDPDRKRTGFAVRPPGIPFAFEYASRTTFREMNFGRRTHQGQPTKFAGEEIPRQGFRVCKFCGSVQSARKSAAPQHASSCRKASYRAYADSPGSLDLDGNSAALSSDSDMLDCLYLYREFESESLRMLVPVIEDVRNGPQVQSFIAAVELGLRVKFRGRVDHLRAMTSSSVGHHDGVPRSYVVLFDTVPGGTGYLKQLVGEPTGIPDVLATARERLKECECDDGCYRCVYAYRRGREMAQTSKRRAIDLLDQILADAVAEQLVSIADIENVGIASLVESALEARFIRAIEKRVATNRQLSFRKEIVYGKNGYVLRVGQEVWKVEPQASLGWHDTVCEASSPDFLFRPAKSGSSRQPVAVFLDGFKYHKDRTDEDSAKRMALLHANYFQWSLTWHDLDVAFDGEADAADLLRHPIQSGTEANSMEPFQKGLDARWGTGPLRAGLRQSSFNLLFRYLGNPDANSWKQAVFTEVFRIFDTASMQNTAFKKEFNGGLYRELPSQATDTVAELAAPVFYAASRRSLGEASGHVNVYAAVSSEAIQQADPDKMFVAVHLHDTHPKGLEYRIGWNGVLRLFNMIQFLPHSWWTTTAAVKQGLYQGFTGSLDTVDEIDQDWSAAIDNADPSVHDLLGSFARMDVPVPEVGYELGGPSGEVVAEAELAWTGDSVAVLMPDQPYSEEFRAAGWRVFDSGTRKDSIVKALRGDSTDQKKNG